MNEFRGLSDPQYNAKLRDKPDQLGSNLKNAIEFRLKGWSVGEGELENVTRLLLDFSAGDGKAHDQLFPLIFAELKRIAGAYMRRESSGHTLQPTALVHEAYIKLIDQNQVDWQNRQHFYAIAAKVMRRILVDHARGKKAQKRGDGQEHVNLDDVSVSNDQPDFVELDRALAELSRDRPRTGQIVELKFFGGLTVEEIAKSLDISTPTVKREWSFAKAWLQSELQKDG
jgi:RNA polymerase sigma factor (TIGR02999 family)